MRGKPAVVVLLVDLLDASGTLMGRVRDITGNNPVVLVGTKVRGSSLGCAWLLTA